MLQTLLPPDRLSPTLSPVTAGNRGRQRTSHRLRFDRTIGFWLGGILLGTAGCIIGASAPYHHPVALRVSALWWGLYFGCLGASVGGLIGMLIERISAPRSPESDDTEERARGVPTGPSGPPAAPRRRPRRLTVAR